MSRNANGCAPIRPDELSQRIEEWRSTRRHGMAMPEELWRAATELAVRSNATRVARALKIDYAKLKRQVDSAVSVPDCGTGPRFVELSFAGHAPPPCSIELERPDGARMIVREVRSDVARELLESFLDSTR